MPRPFKEFYEQQLKTGKIRKLKKLKIGDKNRITRGIRVSRSKLANAESKLFVAKKIMDDYGYLVVVGTEMQSISDTINSLIDRINSLENLFNDTLEVVD